VSWGQDPLKQLISREVRRSIKAHIKDDQLILTVFLPVGRVLEALEKIEGGRSLSDKLRIIADQLDHPVD